MKVDAKALSLAIERVRALPAELRRKMAERLQARDAGAAIVEMLERRVAKER